MDKVPLILTEIEKIKGITNGILVAQKLGLDDYYTDEIDSINGIITSIQSTEIKKVINKFQKKVFNVFEHNISKYKNFNIGLSILNVSWSTYNDSISIWFAGKEIFKESSKIGCDLYLSLINNEERMFNDCMKIIDLFFDRIELLESKFLPNDDKDENVNLSINHKTVNRDIHLVMGLIYKDITDNIAYKRNVQTIELNEFLNCDINHFINEMIKEKDSICMSANLTKIDIINKLNESARNKLERINELYYKNTNQSVDDLLQIDKSLLKILDTLGGKNNEI